MNDEETLPPAIEPTPKKPRPKRKAKAKKKKAKAKAKKKAAPRKRKAKLAPLRLNQLSDSPPQPIIDLNRERAKVADFLRTQGREWRYAGPNPFMAGCQVDARVLKEYAPRLDEMRQALRDLRDSMPPGARAIPMPDGL